MRASSLPPPRLLIVEADAALRDFLAVLVQDAGYEVLVAASPQEAHALLAAQPVHLLVVDLGPPRTDDPFGPARDLPTRAAPRPVGLLTAGDLTEDDATRQGFAFLVSMPFDIDDLLLRIARSLARPGSRVERSWEAVVRRYFAALAARDWDALVALCAEEVSYVLPRPAPFAAIVQGKAALRAYTEETYRHFPLVTFSNVQTFALPRGIVGRYKGSWRTATGSEGQQEGAVVFMFAGELIVQIGVRLDAERLRALLADRSG